MTYNDTLTAAQLRVGQPVLVVEGMPEPHSHIGQTWASDDGGATWRLATDEERQQYVDLARYPCCPHGPLSIAGI